MQCILWLHNYSRLTGQHYKSRKIYMGLPPDLWVNDNFYSFRNDQLPQKNLEGPKLNRKKLQIFISFLQAKFGAFDFLTHWESNNTLRPSRKNDKFTESHDGASSRNEGSLSSTGSTRTSGQVSGVQGDPKNWVRALVRAISLWQVCPAKWDCSKLLEDQDNSSVGLSKLSQVAWNADCRFQPFDVDVLLLKIGFAYLLLIS